MFRSMPAADFDSPPIASASRLTRRSFVAGLAAMTIPARSEGAANVRRFGVVGDGQHDDTAAFATALRSTSALFVPAGIYLVDRIVVPNGRRILTDGYSTIFRQRAGTPDETRLLNIVGSNVSVGDCSVEGNIATDTGEQRHGIFVAATRETGDLANIALGNVRGRNLRGDVVYVGSRFGYTARNIRIGNVEATNILRNIVSVVGGRNIRIGRITGTYVGYTHLDIEPDDYNGPVIGCSVDSVQGSFVQVAGSSAKAYVDLIRIGLLDLSAPVQRSTPPYPPGVKREDALLIRNVHSLDIYRLLARGFEGNAIRQIWDPGGIADQNIHIASAELSDCARGPRAGRAYILGSEHATRLRIDSLTVRVSEPRIDVVRNCKDAHIGAVNGRLPSGTRLIAESAHVWDPLLYLIGGGAAFYASARLAKGVIA